MSETSVPTVRRSLAAALAFIAFAACGGDDAASGTTTESVATTSIATESSNQPAQTTVAESPLTEPATVATTEPPGTTPADATTSPPSSIDDALADSRVVVLAEEFMLADVMALGIDPVASTASVSEVGFQGLDEYDTTGIQVLPMTTLNLEQLTAIEPDVIVTLQFWADQVGESVLAEIAELVIVPDGRTIPERLTVLGDQLGRADEAASVIGELEAAQARAAEAVPDDCVVSLAAIYSGPSPAAFVAGPWELPTSILSTGCVLDPDPSVAEPDQNGRVYLSLEQLGILDAPILVLLQSDTVEGEQQAVEEIGLNPLWKNLPAVRAGQVYTFDRLGYPGATGQIRFLEDFAAIFS